MHSEPTTRSSDHRWPDLRELAAGLAGGLGAPVVVLDAQHGPVATGGVHAPALCERLREDGVRAVLRQVAPGRGSIRATHPAGDGMVFVASRAVLTGQILGYLLASVPAPQADVALRTLEQASTAVAVELLVHERIRHAIDAEEREVFFDLVEGRALGRIVPRARRLGFDLVQAHTPLVCRIVPRQGGSATTDRAPEDLERLFLESYSVSMPSDSPRPLFGDVGDTELLAFLPTTDQHVVQLVGTALLGRAVRAGRSVRVGTGPACTAPESFAQNAEYARRAAEILERGGLFRAMASFEELGVYTLLFNAAHADELDEFVQRWIGPLIEYDTKRMADMTATLAVLLEGRGLRQAADRLAVHVSTLKYRIKRINQILAVDYHDPEIAFNLQLAVRVFNVMRGPFGRSGENK